MKNIVIIGAGGFGKEVAWIIDRINAINPTWNLLGFLDDNPAIMGSNVYKDYTVIGKTNSVSKFLDSYFVCAVGSSKARKEIVSRIGNLRFATIIDPAAIIDPTANIGEGCIICQNTLVSVNVSIGNHCSVIYGTYIGHDANLGSFVTLYPSVNISGNVEISDVVDVGTGTKIIQQKNIGKNVVIGAGAVVINDLPDGSKAVGVPARVIKTEESV